MQTNRVVTGGLQVRGGNELIESTSTELRIWWNTVAGPRQLPSRNYAVAFSSCGNYRISTT